MPYLENSSPKEGNRCFLWPNHLTTPVYKNNSEFSMAFSMDLRANSSSSAQRFGTQARSPDCLVWDAAPPRTSYVILGNLLNLSASVPSGGKQIIAPSPPGGKPERMLTQVIHEKSSPPSHFHVQTFPKSTNRNCFQSALPCLK